MEDFISILNLLVGLVTGGGMGMFLYYRQNKHTKELENDKMASEQWHELFDDEHQRNSVLHDRIKVLRDENEKLKDEANVFHVENAHLQLTRCQVNGCDKRQPPRDWEKV